MEQHSNSTSCEQCASVLDDWRRGALDPQQARALEDHLALCSTCLETLLAAERVGDLLRQSIPPLSPLSAAYIEEVNARVRNRLHEEQIREISPASATETHTFTATTAAGRSFRRSRPLWAAMAATALVAAGLTWIVARGTVQEALTPQVHVARTTAETQNRPAVPPAADTAQPAARPEKKSALPQNPASPAAAAAPASGAGAPAAEQIMAESADAQAAPAPVAGVDRAAARRRTTAGAAQPSVSPAPGAAPAVARRKLGEATADMAEAAVAQPDQAPPPGQARASASAAASLPAGTDSTPARQLAAEAKQFSRNVHRAEPGAADETAALPTRKQPSVADDNRLSKAQVPPASVAAAPAGAASAPAAAPESSPVASAGSKSGALTTGLVRRPAARFYQQAEEARQAGDFEQAVRLYEAAAAANPGSAMAARSLLGVGDISYDQLDDRQRARQAYQECLAPALAGHLDSATRDRIRTRLDILQ